MYIQHLTKFSIVNNFDKKAVIFDMDGVIIDSEPLWKEAEISVFKKYGYNFTYEMCEETKGMRVDEVTVYWKKKLKANFNAGQVKDDIIAAIINLIKDKGKAMEGLNEVVHKLSSQGFKIGLASSSPLAIIETVIKKLEIENYFEVIHSAEFETYGKPHPQVFITAAKKLNIPVENCWVIEDSFYGLIAAIAAKMKTIALPASDEPNIKKFIIADFIANSHIDIIKNEPYNNF